MAKHLFLETTAPLLRSYETLALQHQKNRNGNYHTAFPLLMINASIVEGMLRFWLVNAVKQAMNEMVVEGTAFGRTSKSKAEQLLEKYLIEIEGTGGFEKLKSHYKFFFSVQVDQNSTEYDIKSIKALFTLRNVLAHGTSIVAPSVPSSSPNGQDYADSWQSKLQMTLDILKEVTGCNDIFSALNDPRVPRHFFENSVRLLKNVRSKLPDDLNVGAAFADIERMCFGYRQLT